MGQHCSHLERYPFALNTVIRHRTGRKGRVIREHASPKKSDCTTWPSRPVTWPAPLLRLLPRAVPLLLCLSLLPKRQHAPLEYFSNGVNIRAPFAAAGSLCTSSDTGTTPPFNILSSICSCSMPSSSVSRSCSSTGSPIGTEVMASPISWPRACCSRSSSLLQ